MLGVRQTTNGEDTFGSGSGIVCGINLRRAHVELAQPNGRIGGIESHEAIVQEEEEKAKPPRERPLDSVFTPTQHVRIGRAVRAAGGRT